jgi:hypothetical protein
VFGVLDTVKRSQRIIATLACRTPRGVSVGPGQLGSMGSDLLICGAPHTKQSLGINNPSSSQEWRGNNTVVLADFPSLLNILALLI